MRRIKTAAPPDSTPDVPAGAARVYLRNTSCEYPVSRLSRHGRHIGARIVVLISTEMTSSAGRLDKNQG